MPPLPRRFAARSSAPRPWAEVANANATASPKAVTSLIELLLLENRDGNMCTTKKPKKQAVGRLAALKNRDRILQRNKSAGNRGSIRWATNGGSPLLVRNQSFWCNVLGDQSLPKRRNMPQDLRARSTICTRPSSAYTIATFYSIAAGMRCLDTGELRLPTYETLALE